MDTRQTSDLNLIRKHHDELLSSMISNPGGIESLVRKLDSIGLLFPEAIKQVFVTYNPSSLTNEGFTVAILKYLEIVIDISLEYIPPVVHVLKEQSFLTATNDVNVPTTNELNSRSQLEKCFSDTLECGRLSRKSESLDFLESQAENLQVAFNQIHPAIIQSLNATDSNVQLFKSLLIVLMQFNAEQNASGFKLSRLESKNSFSDILKLLVSKKLLGFFNIQLLQLLFEPFVTPRSDAYNKIEAYKKQHREFISISLSRFAELIDEREDLLSSASGLPKITFVLQKNQWEDTSFFEWSGLLKHCCTWPDCFLLQRIEEVGNEITLEYSVLPFMVARVFNTLSNDDTLQIFAKFGVSYVVAGTELQRIAADETAWIQASVQKASSKSLKKDEQLDQATGGKINRLSQVCFSDYVQFDSSSKGFPHEIFINYPPDDWLCSICKLVMRNPVQIKCCEKSMCQACVKESDASCPECGSKDIAESIPDKNCRRTSLNSHVQCIEEGCSWKGILARYELHIQDSHSQEQVGKSGSSNPDENSVKPSNSQASHKASSNPKPRPNVMPKPRSRRNFSISVHFFNPPHRGNSTVRLSWEKPKINPPITYSVCYRRDDADHNMINCKWTECDETTTETFEVDTLIPNETYFFKVKAFDYLKKVVAQSETSESITILSTHRVLSPPKVKNFSEDTVHLTWETNYETHGKLTYSIIYSTTNNTGKWIEYSSDVHTQSIKLQGLDPNKTYCFKVKLFDGPDEICVSEASKWINLSALPNLPDVINISDKSITIEWSQSEVQTYNVQFTKKDGPENWNTIQTRDRKVTVHGLAPDTRYLFKIQVQNGSDVSQSSETIEVKTYPIPLPPGRPYSLSIESESIELSWDPPKSNLELKEYQLVACTIPNHTKCDSFSFMINNKCIVKSLSPGTEYSFFVKAIYSNGLQSEWSECSKAICTNIKNICEKPTASSTKITISIEKPRIKGVTSSSVCLEWRPSHNQAIKKYRVFYSKKEKHHWKSVKTQDDTPEITIVGLDHSTEYFFKVRAKFLKKQYSDYSEESDAVKTLPICASPPGKPRPVPCPDGSFELKWNKPKHGANAVNHYLVQYATSEMYNENHKPPDGSWPNFQEQYTSANAKINNLKLGIKYCFRIAAICDGGRACSDPTQWIRVKYPPPPAPGMPYATAVEETTIHLKWKRPEYEYQIEYNVYCLQEHFGSAITHSLIRTEEAQVSDLNPNKKYRFQIEAVNPDGVSKMGPEGDLITTNRALPHPPGRLYILRVTHDTVKLRWEKPQNGVNTPSHYKIQFKHLGDSTWNQKKTKNVDTNFEVDGLQPSAKYVFKVSACYKDGAESADSDESELVTLKSAVPSAPGKPVGKPDSSNPGSVRVTWSKPQNYADQIKCYEISYYEDGAPDADNRKIERTKDAVEKLRINKLTPGKGYYFEVRAVTRGGEKSEPSFLSDLITNESLAETFLNSCTRITEAGSIPVYQLPVKKVHEDKEDMLIKYDVALGQGMPNRPKDKVLMLVGPTGSGKTTIINGLVNYILRVQYGGEFRYKLIHDTGPQVKSVTSHITAYKIYCETGFPVSFNLTIIDTPGFGDTRGIERDKQTTKQVKKFFEMNNGIPHLDGIGFVCQASSVRLTLTQRFIFDSIFAMFGNDVKDNIFVLCTFCDGEKPKVINAVKEADIPVDDDTFFKFNNSALYAANTNPITELFWNIGIESYRDFLAQFEKARPVSLRLTKEVLQERDTLETIIIGLQERIADGMNLINRLKKEIQILEKNRALIEDNKAFEYEVPEDVMVKVDLEKGVYTTNCLVCNITCHFPCAFANDQDKIRCSAMKRQGNDDASCEVCPKNCHWEQHHNASFKLVTERKNVKKIYEQTKKMYENALNDKLTVENVIEKLKCEIDEAFEGVFQMIQKTNKCTQRLDQIAFRPNHLSDTEYIQLLIEAQKQEKREGYQERIEAYRVLQERAKLLQEAKMISDRTKADQWDKRWWEKFYM